MRPRAAAGAEARSCARDAVVECGARPRATAGGKAGWRPRARPRLSPLLRVPEIDCSSALTNAVTGQHALASRTREIISGFGYVT